MTVRPIPKQPTPDSLPCRMILKLNSFMQLSADEVAVLQALEQRRRRVEARQDIILAGAWHDLIFIVQEGWAYRYKLLADGRRQVLNFILPGDFIGLRTEWMPCVAHSYETVTAVALSEVPAERVFELWRKVPRLGTALAWAAAREEAMLAERVISIGRRSAYERIAHLIIELLHRLQSVELAGTRSYELPVTQEVMADALGLSVVHVNRTLQRLRRQGLITFQRRRIVIRDLDGLAAASGFEEEYLRPPPLPRETEARMVRIA